MAKRMKTGGRTKKAEDEKYKRETFTLSPGASSILEDQDNASAYVDEAIRERYKSEGMELHSIRIEQGRLVKIFEGVTWNQACIVGHYWGGYRPDLSKHPRLKIICSYIDKCDESAKLFVDDILEQHPPTPPGAGD